MHISTLQLIVNTHIRRFRNTYGEYFELEESHNLVQYFFNRIYILEGKAERDQMAEKTFKRFGSFISENSKTRLEKLMHLNWLTDELDAQMAEYIEANQGIYDSCRGQDFIADDIMKKLYVNANTFESRVEQLSLLIFNLESFFELSKHPLADVVMKPIQFASAMVGAKKLYEVFEEGYKATRPVSKDLFYEFTSTVRKREKDFLENLYGKPVVLT